MIPRTRKVILAVVAFTPLFFSCQPEAVEELEQVVAISKTDTFCLEVYPFVDKPECIYKEPKLKAVPTKGTNSNSKCAKGDCFIKTQGPYYFRQSDAERVANPYGIIEVDVEGKGNGLNTPSQYTEVSKCHRRTVYFKGPAHVKLTKAELVQALEEIYQTLDECYRFYGEE